jgi:hypothetical protein
LQDEALAFGGIVMIANVFCAQGRRASMVVLIGMLIAGPAVAYVGDSFLRIPGVAGDWRGAQYDHWVRVDANYWKSEEGGMYASLRQTLRRPKQFFSAPPAPPEGASSLMISLDKRSPALPALMKRCTDKTVMPELTYAESSVLSRSLRELGPRPADIPEYFEYRLKDVRFTDCPVVQGAVDQALVVSFNDIEWLNYYGKPEGVAVALAPSKVALESSPVSPAKFSGKTLAFVVTWFAVANDVSDDQCTKMNSKPTQDDFYALMPKEQADIERAKYAKAGGVNYENGEMERRGPDGLNACLLPGITRDPGLSSPRKIARGLDLDGSDGTHGSAVRSCKHEKFFSPDGRVGIDNQLYRVQGCMAGFQGHKGFLMQYRNEQRRNGLLSMLVQVSGIDNDVNDDSIDVTVLYSLDHMAKDASGKQILPDYSFRLTDNPEYTHYFTRLHGRIVNGVIVTEPVKQLQFNPGLDPELTLADAQMRLQILPDGTLKGLVGGYQDWRREMKLNAMSNSESLYGFQCPAMYSALKHAADGIKNPDTGECDGISTAYDIEGVAAFVVPAPREAQPTQARIESSLEAR